MSTVRLRRLQADYERLHEYVSRHPRLQLIQAQGSPPERYQIEYQIKSLRQKDGQLETVASHLVEIALPRDYPRTPPLCRMLTPVFHPNIAPHAICIGDHWSAGESLKSLVSRIGEILSYQSYNTKSPLNGEAARWVDGNIDKLPLDNVNMTVEETGAGGPPPPAPPPTDPRPIHRAATAPPPPPQMPPPPQVSRYGFPVAQQQYGPPAPQPQYGAPAPQPQYAPPPPQQYAPPPPPRQQYAAPAPPAAAAPVAPSPTAAAAAAPVEFSCPACAGRLRLRQRPAQGARLRCPHCQTVFEAPQL